MRLQLISDLHTEFYDMPKVNQIPLAENLDVLVIAGDLVVPARQHPKVVRRVIQYFSDKVPYILYVSGNHEYYGGSREQVEFTLRSYMPKNFVWLNNEEVTIKGQHFYGGTMWFKPDPLNQFYEKNLSDFEVIKGNFREWVYQENALFRANAEKLVTPDTVVISHHLPHPRSTPLQFFNSPINRFFVSDESYLIEQKQPKLWLHGHTHHWCDYTLGNTRVLCYPFGYPHERPNLSKKQQDYEPEVVEF